MSGDRIQLIVNQEPTPARAGQSVAAALLEAGYVAWRRTRHGGRPRGAFCGIGVCFDCLATIDDVAARRTCLVEVAEGMRVQLDGEVER
ncbi:(2Fe-2S)-binding protein [Naumannella halotolerans]|uniref:2Fe-2S iron-sulfur cluster protein n=1 Tax=Naumannella halotolerans TaxID=993414 RepID=A0A4R7J944_9ACTN|nr:(2Fe-2S)-binding protein [Naumannella halotolerans]TDT33376.1 2Fe-2S iron-sulfur cluster protein [Naumannella halotolerans]